MPDTPVKLEDHYKPGEEAIKVIQKEYADFFLFRDRRSQNFSQIQDYLLEEYWTESRKLFWNSLVTKSEDLQALGLDFSLPFIRKEVMDYVGRVVSMNIIPVLGGDDQAMHAMRLLDGMYRKWRLKSNDRVEKFWQILDGAINGTQCSYVGFSADEKEFRYLTSLSPEGVPTFEKQKTKKWNDAYTEPVPLEEMYLRKPWERNIQKQGKTIRKQEMTLADFQKEFPETRYPQAKYVRPASQIAEDSLYFQLLAGANLTGRDKIQVLTSFDTDLDQKVIIANGVWLNPMTGNVIEANPFTHKMQPYTWVLNEAIDNKFAYGLALPFKIKDPHKILNTAYTMMVERELREIDPPILSSDFEAPELIFGQGKVINVNDVQAYKELQLSPTSGAFQNFMNSVQGQMNSFAQGGFSQMAPSRQPRAAREIVALENLKQQSLGNALIMYYDLVFQELMLVLKTQLQFYAAEHYSKSKEKIVRQFTVGAMPLSQGGIGNVDIRIVNDDKQSSPLDLYFEAVKRSIQTGKQTEILEASISFIQNLEFYIDNIKLEPEKSSELERSLWSEQILKPAMELFVPMGLADPGKTFLRWLEKMNEHPSDFTSDQMLNQLRNGTAAPMPPGGMGPTQNQTGNMMQSQRGMAFGSKASMPVPDEVTM